MIAAIYAGKSTEQSGIADEQKSVARRVATSTSRRRPSIATTPGPLFVTRGQRRKRRDGRLETRSVLRIVRELGQTWGVT